MALTISVHANADDALVAWRLKDAQTGAPKPFPAAWVGFSLTRRDATSLAEVPVNNRIPASGNAPVPADGVSSLVSPIRRCMWIDHALNERDRVQYKVTPMRAKAGGGFEEIPAETSGWSAEVTASAAGDDGVRAVFNRGVLMSQVVSRFVHGDVSVASLKALVKRLSQPGEIPRRYLAGQARHELLNFMASADQKGGEIHAALYECNDPELISGLKAFGARGHVLLGNGGATKDGLADELRASGLDVHTRDLSKSGASSPSVHNKFVVETQQGAPARVLTGSTNWTTTGLCTQLNNVLVINRPKLAARFRKQWDKLVAAHDDMTPALKTSNAKAELDGDAELRFAATTAGPEMAEVESLIRGATQAVYFLMFMPGQSPLLLAALDRNAEANGPVVRGVVSTVTETAKGRVLSHQAHVVSKDKNLVLDETRTRTQVILPTGAVKPSQAPSWALGEFQATQFLAAGLRAIVHSKTVVIDPFTDHPAVVTGSHNFSPSAAQKNDENLVIIRGDKALAERYAVHIQGVYDHYAYRAFLHEGGQASQLSGLAAWTAGDKARDLDIWVG